MTPQRYDLKEWWSKVTKKPYEKFIPWSQISTDTNLGLDPKLNDQVIFKMLNVESIVDEIHGRWNYTPGEIYANDFMRPNVENDFKFSLEFINSNQCERLLIIEDKYEKYHNDLNVALYGNEEQFNVENGVIDWGNSFYYTKETCETDERRHECFDILVLILTRSASPDFRS